MQSVKRLPRYCVPYNDSHCHKIPILSESRGSHSAPVSANSIHGTNLFVPNDRDEKSWLKTTGVEVSYEEEVRTIRAQAGKNPGECVGSYGKSLVFLPRGCEPDREYRVKLAYASKDALGEPRRDRAGKPLYRGNPAPDEVSERWVENKDGTVSRCRVITNWKLEEKLHPIETRAKVKRDGDPIVRGEVAHDFGTGLASARVTVTTKTEIPVLEEYVETMYSLSSKAIAWRDGGTKVETFAVESIEAMRSGYVEANDWLNNRLRSRYDGESWTLYVSLRLNYATEKSVEVRSTKWVDLPIWLQAHLAVPYPICGCGRERVETPAGHTTCRECRAEAAEQAVIDELLPAEKRAKFAMIAAACDAAASEGKAFEGEGGADLVIALTGDCRPEDLRSWKGYPWYYLTSKGIFASRLPPEAMMILGAGLVGATGRGLVTLACWITSEHHSDNCDSDFYARTQVRGEEVEPRADRYGMADACVAVKLRGTEADRQSALAVRAEADALRANVYLGDKRIALADYAGAESEWLETIQARREQIRAHKEADLAREEAEAPHRLELAGLLAHGHVQGNLEMASQIDAFVKDAFEMRGAHEAVRLLRMEECEAYGRAARKAAIADRNFPGISTRGLDWAAGRDIVPVLFWAEILLEKRGGFGQKKAFVWDTHGQGSKPEPVGERVSVTLTDSGDGRHFRCSCGGLHRATKAESRSYVAGDEVELACSGCGGAGTVQRTVEKAQANSTTGTDSVDLMAQLREKLGRK